MNREIIIITNNTKVGRIHFAFTNAKIGDTFSHFLDFEKREIERKRCHKKCLNDLEEFTNLLDKKIRKIEDKIIEIKD